jgi:hypothetical protein
MQQRLIAIVSADAAAAKAAAGAEKIAGAVASRRIGAGAEASRAVAAEAADGAAAAAHLTSKCNVAAAAATDVFPESRAPRARRQCRHAQLPCITRTRGSTPAHVSVLKAKKGCTKQCAL